MQKTLPKRVEMEFKGGLNEAITAHTVVTPLIELGRISEVMATAERCLPPKKSPKGLGQGQFVESFVVLSALGGDCADDFDTLRQDVGLEAMLGYQLPAASTGRQWLDLFHEGKLLGWVGSALLSADLVHPAILPSVRPISTHCASAKLQQRPLPKDTARRETPQTPKSGFTHGLGCHFLGVVFPKSLAE